MYSKEDILKCQNNIDKNIYEVYMSVDIIQHTSFEEQLKYLYKDLDYIKFCDIEKYPELYDYYVLSKV
jgi:hypothetical protein